jgi:sugar transferase EpsL
MKRALDLVIAILGLILLIPVLLTLAVGILVTLGSPITFKQHRIGLDGRDFRIFKFRTMSNERGALGELLPDSSRLGRFGGVLRSLSLDELPTLWNVLKGDMSLVGPRPLLEKYRDLYTDEQFRRHEVLPGITGWAQVNGRNNLDWEEKFELDVWYVDNQTLWLDFRILLLTLVRVLQKKDINSDGHATMEEFKGG